MHVHSVRVVLSSPLMDMEILTFLQCHFQSVFSAYLHVFYSSYPFVN